MTFKRTLGLAAASVTLAVAPGCGPSDTGPLDPLAALSTLRVADGFRVDLFAAEPDVVDPVEVAFDEFGGLYVAELLDNPDDPRPGDPPRSRIKYLEDTDGDGTADRSTLFADRLLGVEGLAPWQGGIVVTAAPDILYLKDDDGDRRADRREVLYTGFGPAHVEARISNPRLGLDNWFYVVNFRQPGEVFAPDQPGSRRLNVRNREFRFHPMRGLAETAPGRTQFGQSANQWGHWFGAHNTVHLRHTVFPPRYQDRNPMLGLESVAQDISDHGRPAARVYPLSQPERWRVERTDARTRRYEQTQPGRVERLEGYFTAAAGTTVYLGDTFPHPLYGAAFVGDGNGNLVHVDVLRPEGATYVASRWPENGEFLASTDNWFRPINFANGPDGNLYVVDYYRQYLEHPDFIPESIKRRLGMDFRAGDTMGRIYRVSPGVSSHSEPSDLPGDASPPELVKMLGHPNGWYRRTAQRLLVERRAVDVADAVRETAVSGAHAEARLHALWTLEGIGEIDYDTIRAALKDEHHAVRESALRLAESDIDTFSGEILAALQDPAPRVAFQATLMAGSLDVDAGVVSSLAAILDQFPDDSWFHEAVLCAPASLALPVLRTLARTSPRFFEDLSGSRLTYLRRAARIVGAVRVPSQVIELLRLVSSPELLGKAQGRIAALEGLEVGLGLQPDRRLPSSLSLLPLDRLLGDPSPAVQSASAAVARHFDLEARASKLTRTALDSRSTLVSRLSSIRMLAACNYHDVEPALRSLVADSSNAEVQTAAVRSLASFERPEAADALVAAWPSYTPAVGSLVADALIRRDLFAKAFVDALGSGRIDANTVEPVSRIRLSQHPNGSVRAAARSVPVNVGERDHVVARYFSALDLDAKPKRGEAVFDRECSRCHRANASRGRIGPDLSGVSNRGREDLLTSILDPSYAIEDRYRNWLLSTKDGRFVDGILVAETGASVTLRGEQKNIVVLKEDVSELRPSTVSLMPEGLEEAIGLQDMADLIAYLQAGL